MKIDLIHSFHSKEKRKKMDRVKWHQWERKGCTFTLRLGEKKRKRDRICFRGGGWVPRVEGGRRKGKDERWREIHPAGRAHRILRILCRCCFDLPRWPSQESNLLAIDRRYLWDRRARLSVLSFRSALLKELKLKQAKSKER